MRGYALGILISWSRRRAASAIVTNWMDGPGKIAMSVNYRGSGVRTDEGWLVKDISARVLPE